MKIRFTLLAAIGLFATAQAQTPFQDDFESYTAGDFISAVSSDWETWSGNTGGADDVEVVNTNASSGSNSLHFEAATSQGGPDDIVLPFGGAYNSGMFNFEMRMMVESGHGAYWNFQGEESIGSVWSLNCDMDENGNLTLRDGNNLLTTTYPVGSWFILWVSINFNTNTWELYIDGVSQGTFSPDVNQVAALNLYPVNNAGNGAASFWVDDVTYVYTPPSLPGLNAAVVAVDGVLGLAGQEKTVVAGVRNVGLDAVTSFDLTLDYNGESITENFTTNLASLESEEFTFSEKITLVAGENPVSITVSNVNGGGADEDASDDTKTEDIDPLVPAEGKFVIGEEATGTWCGWCPRGTVALKHMEETYPEYFQGIAVHNGDPMANTVYDDGMNTIITGYPSAVVDRESDINPTQIEDEFLDNITRKPTATIENGAVIDEENGVIKISLTYHFIGGTSGNWKAAAVLIEDGVTGTASGYAQSNFYSGGNNGEMGGYEDLPNPVPASQMVYDHVARAIVPSFEGLDNAFEGPMQPGDEMTLNFEVPYDASWDLSKVKVVGLLIANNDLINNGSSTTLDEAIDHGFFPTDVIEVGTTANWQLFPNPATDQSFLELELPETELVQVTVRSVTGQVVAQRSYGKLSGSLRLPINTANWAKGMYLVELQTGDQLDVSRLVVD